MSLANNFPVLASLGICVALLVLTPDKQSAAWVFTNVTDGSGWGSKGFSFLLGSVITCRALKPSTDSHQQLSICCMDNGWFDYPRIS